MEEFTHEEIVAKIELQMWSKVFEVQEWFSTHSKTIGEATLWTSFIGGIFEAFVFQHPAVALGLWILDVIYIIDVSLL